MNKDAKYQSKPRAGGPVFAKQVGSFVPRIARAVFEAHGFPSAEVLSEWPAIAGPDLATFTAPERLIWPRRTNDTMREDQTNARQSAHRPAGATLVLRVDGPRALEVQHGAQQIIEKVNGYFGYRAISTLRIVQGPVARRQRKTRAAPPKEIAPDETGLDRISDDRLKHALARLAAQVD
jgi:hypothetical protein